MSGLEFVAIRTVKYMVCLTSYKMIMIGVYIYGKDNSFSDNKVVWKSARRMEANIKKKHVSI